MAGMAIAILGVLNISETGDIMNGQNPVTQEQKTGENGQKTYQIGKKTGVSILAIPVKEVQCRPCFEQCSVWER